jgi:hypothetical protein
MASAATTLADSRALRRSWATSFAKLGGRSRFTLGAWTRGGGLTRTEPSGMRLNVSR